jgi:hypothetical protein
MIAGGVFVTKVFLIPMKEVGIVSKTIITMAKLDIFEIEIPAKIPEKNNE